MNSYLEEVLRKMCEVAGVKYEDVDLTEDLWNDKYSWLPEERAEFLDWLTDWLKNRSNFDNFVGTDESRCLASRRKIADDFVVLFGWRLLV